MKWALLFEYEYSIIHAVTIFYIGHTFIFEIVIQYGDEIHFLYQSSSEGTEYRMSLCIFVCMRK